MATITELSLFKACVEDPQHIASLQDLNLEMVSDPQQMEGITEKQYFQKKSLKLFHMAWSGVTKYMRTVTQGKCKPVEFPGLGIFMPVLAQRGQEMQSAKLTAGALGKLNPEDMDVALVVSQSFLNSCGGSVRVAESADGEQSLISSYDPHQGEQMSYNGLQHINMASISRVCSTDIVTVEMILKEIVAQLRHQLKKGNKIRMMFKIGKLISQNGELKWSSYREGDQMSKTFNNDGSSTTYSRQMVNSQYRKEFSVMTPSVAKTRAFSQKDSEMKSFHMANPNPQGFNPKHKGVRDVGYKNYEKLIDPTDVIKFGKKVNYENKATNDQIMEEHLRQMREKMEVNKLSHDLKRKQEKDFLTHIRKLDELEKQRYNMGKHAINNDFVYYNGKIVGENNDKKKRDNEGKHAEKYNYFPFVSGDLIEKHRASLGAQLKNDLQSYLDYQTQKGDKGSSARKSGNAALNYDVNSVISMNVTTNSLLNVGSNRSRAVKQLFDSEYVKPEDNFRVYQDNNPTKSAAMKNALQRYEETLKGDNKVLGNHMQEHRNKIKFDDDEVQRERQMKSNKQSQFRSQIQEQMAANEEQRLRQRAIDKLPISTGFTPETNIGEAAALFKKKREQQDHVKTLLTRQMETKTDVTHLQKKAKIDEENQAIEENKKILAQIKEKKKQHKEKAKEHWDGELKRVEGLKRIKEVEAGNIARNLPLEPAH